MTTSDTTKTFRVGVVGAGDIGQGVGSQFEAHPRARVEAVADVNETACRAAGDHLSVAPSAQYEDSAEMFAREELDGVLLSTPHTLHYEQVCAALDAGIDVLCAKPLATDLERVRDLIERDERSDATLAVDYERHLNQAFVRARERWRTGTEKPTYFTAEVTQDWLDQVGGTWRTDPELSGGRHYIRYG